MEIVVTGATAVIMATMRTADATMTTGGDVRCAASRAAGPLRSHAARIATAMAAMLLLAAETRVSALDLDVVAAGARGDGVTLATLPIQQAIDRCSAAGGGVVTVPSGRFRVGTLRLKDGVHLQLDRDAVLLGSVAADDYRNLDPFTDGTGASMGYALLVAMDAKDVAITGPGTIDGQGKEVAARQQEQGGYRIRPFLVRLIRCEHARLRGVRLVDAGAWTVNLFQCRHAVVEGVTIASKGLRNNDGIDLDSCQDVQVTGCDIDSGDDAVCLKTTSPLACEDIAVTGCTLRSGCGTIKLGTESVGDFSRIAVRACRITGAGLGGIKILSVDGAHVQQVEIADIRMDQVRVPIFIRLGARLKTFRAGDRKREIGSIRDVSVRDVRATAADVVGLLVSGIPDHPVEGLRLQDVSIQLRGGGAADAAATAPGEHESAYPEIRMFGEALPAHGAFCRHVRGLTVSGWDLATLAPDQRPALALVDVTGTPAADWTARAP